MAAPFSLGVVRLVAAEACRGKSGAGIQSARPAEGLQGPNLGRPLCLRNVWHVRARDFQPPSTLLGASCDFAKEVFRVGLARHKFGVCESEQPLELDC